MTEIAATLVAAYLLGSVLFGVILVRATTGADPRTLGSGNPGATNVARIAGKGMGAAALMLDAGKGAAAVLLAETIAPDRSALPAAAAIAAVLGHLFPIFHRFRGGKGVATAMGSFFPLAHLPVLAALTLFLVLLAAFRFVSLASIVATASCAPLCVVWGVPDAVSWAAALTAVLVVTRHRGNVVRLRQGVEPRWGGSRPAGPGP